jgi:type IV pilus assembly protein PilV
METAALKNRSRPVSSGGAGFTLLEVMIALVVLSIGLLGIAALQGVGLRTSHGAYLTSQASLLAYDMADRIRTNPGEFATHDLAFGCPETVALAPLADADMEEWSCAVETILPGGSGTITRTAVSGFMQYTIRVDWQDLQSDETGWNFELTIEL